MGNHKKSYPVCEYDLMGNYIRTWINPAAVAQIYDISARSIWDAANEKLNTAYGRQWRYLKDCNRLQIKTAILTPYVQRKINFNVNSGLYKYDVVVPEELLYTYDKENKQDLINALTKLIGPPLCSHDQQIIKDTIQYLQNKIVP